MRVLKQQLRNQLRSCRRQLTREEQSLYAEQITNHLVHSAFLKEAQHIALYFAIDGEVGTQLILNNLLLQHKSCYVPVLAKPKLEFVKIDETTPMVKNQFGILEPSSSREIISPLALDVVLVPLVAFDNKCQRLGMGAGYYDTTFAFKQGTAKPLLMGLAYDFQKVPKVPINKYDIQLDGVVTEKRLYLRSD